MNPFNFEKEKILQRLSQTKLGPKAIQRQSRGIGFDIAQELTKRLLEHPNGKMVIWDEFFSTINHQPIPTFYETENKDFFTPIAYQVLSEQVSAVTVYPTLSQLLDSYYHEKVEEDRTKQQGGELV